MTLHTQTFVIEIAHRSDATPAIDEHDIARWVEAGYAPERELAAQQRVAVAIGKDIERTVPEIDSFDVKPA